MAFDVRAADEPAKHHVGRAGLVGNVVAAAVAPEAGRVTCDTCDNSPQRVTCDNSPQRVTLRVTCDDSPLESTTATRETTSTRISTTTATRETSSTRESTSSTDTSYHGISPTYTATAAAISSRHKLNAGGPMGQQVARAARHPRRALTLEQAQTERHRPSGRARAIDGTPTAPLSPAMPRKHCTSQQGGDPGDRPQRHGGNHHRRQRSRTCRCYL